MSFWYTEDSYSNPDVEVLAAARPGLMTTRGPILMASSPYSKKGVLWDTFKKHYGPSGSPAVLVAKGTTSDFNPTIPAEEIAREIERDPIRNTAEYLAEFRSDLEAFVSLEAVQACISVGIKERAPQHYTTYFGFVDPSGGSQDSFTLAIGHIEHGRQTVVIDAIRETKPPFSPEATCYEYSQLLKSYRISKVIGDNYAKIWPVEQFGRFGILYEQSAAPKSDLYISFLALLNSHRVDLLDHPKLSISSSASNAAPHAVPAKTQSTILPTPTTTWLTQSLAYVPSTTGLVLMTSATAVGRTMPTTKKVSIKIPRPSRTDCWVSVTA